MERATRESNAESLLIERISGIVGTLKVGHDTISPILQSWDAKPDPDIKRTLDCLLLLLNRRAKDCMMHARTQPTLEATALLQELSDRWRFQADSEKRQVVRRALLLIDQNRYELTKFLRSHGENTPEIAPQKNYVRREYSCGPNSPTPQQSEFVR